MPESTLDIAGLVRTLVEPIIEHEEDLDVVQSENEDGDILVEVRVNDEDTGKVIGRQGRVIKAIRTLARASATRDNVHVDVQIVE